MIDLYKATLEELFNRGKEIVEEDQQRERPFTPEEKNELEIIGKQVTDLAISKLITGYDYSRRVENQDTHETTSNADSVFWANIFSQIHRNIDSAQQGIASVSIIDHINPFQLNVNPYLIFDICSNYANFIEIITHEGYHLLFEHLDLLSTLIDPKLKGLNPKEHMHKMQILNYATDAEINQLLLNLPENCVTLDTLRQITNNEVEFKEKEGSISYYTKLMDYLENEENNNNQPQEGGNNQSQDDNNDENNDENNNQGNNQEQQDNNTNEDDIKQEKENQDGVNRGRQMGNHDNWEEIATGENGKKENLKNEIKDMVNNALKQMDQKQRSELSGELTERIQIINKPPKLNLKTLTSKSISKINGVNKKSILRLHRRQPYRLDLRGQMKKPMPKVFIGIDTSGSMSLEEDILPSFNEINHIIKTKKVVAELIQIDTEIKASEDISKTLTEIELSGRGGTRITPLFEYLHTQDVPKDSSVIIFTDGMFEPNVKTYKYYNVIWVLTTDYDQYIPTGHTVYKINS